jgi:2',3'-cyclic-nucleotide 2'-phosphodiesterase (5'-nucleotidase family)
MIRILHTNDFHGTLDEARLAKLAAMRAEADFYFDSGDAIRAGNLAIPLAQEPVWGRLAELDCTASVLGNRESHPLEAGFRAKIAGASHPLLCANLRTKDGGHPLSPSMTLVVGGIRVTVIGVMVPMVTERMASRVVSHYLWDAGIPTVAKEVARADADLVIVLSHLGIAKDREMAQTVEGIDIILGGHSHTVLAEPERVGRCFICQGGSHGRFAGRYEWANANLTGGLVPL